LLASLTFLAAILFLFRICKEQSWNN
jgi:hypothetical protein